MHPRVRPRAFGIRGDSAALRSSWTFLGVAGFLVWGIPMGIMIAGLFAKAWRREQFPLTGRLWRGVLWFALYLVMIGFRDRIAFGGDHHAGMRVVRFLLSLIRCGSFWSVTPALLVRDGGRGTPIPDARRPRGGWSSTASCYPSARVGSSRRCSQAGRNSARSVLRWHCLRGAGAVGTGGW